MFKLKLKRWYLYTTIESGWDWIVTEKLPYKDAVDYRTCKSKGFEKLKGKTVYIPLVEIPVSPKLQSFIKKWFS